MGELSWSNETKFQATQINFSIDGGKGQAGCSTQAREMYLDSSQNPVTLNALGNLLLMYQVPDLPQLHPSSAVLKQEWSRLQKYAITSPADPLYKPCEAGANGNEEAAIECVDGWRNRVPTISKRLQDVWEVVRKAFPNKDETGAPYSGAYWNEADFDEVDWQTSHWGSNYKRLLQIKRNYDPDGLFVCHHCVGAEDWTTDGNCRINK